MTRPAKLLEQAAEGKVLTFNELLKLLGAAGFEKQSTTGSHQTWKHPDHPGSRMTVNPNRREKKMASQYQVSNLIAAIASFEIEVK